MKRTKKAAVARDFSQRCGSIPGVFLDELDDRVIVLNRNLTVLFANKACLTNLGYSAGDVSDAPFCRLAEPGEETAIANTLQECLRQGAGCEFECTLISKNGSLSRFGIKAICPALDGHEIYLRLKNVPDARYVDIEGESYKAIVEGAPNPIFIQTDGKFAYLNPAACTFFGIGTPEELIGTPILDRVDPEFHALAGERIRRLNEDRAPATEIVEQRFLRMDGSSVWAQTKGEPIIYKGRNSALVFAHSTTRRRVAEAALRESKELYHKLFEYSALPTCLVGMDGQILNVNANMCKVFGYSRDELLSLRFSDLHHSEQGRLPPNVRDKLLSNEIPSASSEQLYVKKDRTAFWVIVTTAVIRDMNDKPLYFISQLQDVTERRKLLEELRAREEFSRAVMDNLPIGISVNTYKPPLIFEYMNDNFPKLYRTTREALKEPDAFFDAVYEDPDFRETIRKRVLDDIQSRDPGRMRWENVPITRKGSETRYITAFNVLAPGRDMQISIVTDETDRVRAAEMIAQYTTQLEQMIKDRTAELEEAVKELEAFTYSVSHDLRAPLRTVNGFVRILLEDYGSQLDDEGKRVCQVIGNGAQNMGRLIDDLLSLSRVGRTNMVLMPVDVETMVKALFLELTTESQRERIDFSVGHLPQVEADPTLLRHVWMNLLDNAVKFSSKKQRPRIQVAGSISGGEVVYSVTDNGVGFNMEYQDKLFGVFQRLHSVNEFEGTGVGLAIVQRIIRRHGGKIWAHGEENVGASFYFCLKKEGACDDTGNS